MTRHNLLAFVVVSPVLACAGARPPPPATAKAPALTSEMAGLAFYVGRWACHGTALDAAGKEEKAYDLTIEVTPQLDGSWLEIAVIDQGKAVTHELKGFDRRDHKYHHVWASDDGAWGSLTSDGWADDQMVFVDDKPDPGTSPERMVFHKVSDVHYTHRAEAPVGDGWRPTFTKVCDKQS